MKLLKTKGLKTILEHFLVLLFLTTPREKKHHAWRKLMGPRVHGQQGKIKALPPLGEKEHLQKCIVEKRYGICYLHIGLNLW